MGMQIVGGRARAHLDVLRRRRVWNVLRILSRHKILRLLSLVRTLIRGVCTVEIRCEIIHCQIISIGYGVLRGCRFGSARRISRIWADIPTRRDQGHALDGLRNQHKHTVSVALVVPVVKVAASRRASIAGRPIALRQLAVNGHTSVLRDPLVL